MRYLLLTLSLLVSYCTFAQNETKYKEYSYTQFFQMIEDEKDTVFRMQDAIIRYDAKTDSAFKAPLTLDQDSVLNRPKRLTVNKKLELYNVQFYADILNMTKNKGFFHGALVDIIFNQDVILKETAALNIHNCEFKKEFEYQFNDLMLDIEMAREASILSISHSTFNTFTLFKNDLQSNNYNINANIKHNRFISDETKGIAFYLGLYRFYNSTFKNNRIKSAGGIYINHSNGSNGVQFSGNKLIGNDIAWVIQSMEGKVQWRENEFSSFVKMNIDQLNKQDEIDWEPLKNNLSTVDSFLAFHRSTNGNVNFRNLESEKRDQIFKAYVDSVRYYDNSAFANEIALKSMFYEHYKNKYITETANQVYLELKDLETARLKVLYEQNRTFDSYFKWKINQFLKIFAAYGTEPARAITMSVYVVFVFALIYLFFPNYWDSHGKNRIVDRYSFFLKYMKRDAGMQDVYLEEKQNELMAYDDYKQLIESAGKDVPKFFQATALPMYKWAISGTKISATLLSKVDVMKGTWSELPQSKRIWKSILLVSTFLIALVYDIFIKVLNALMLSINTFTTLGFGEIPIKGLPRYLAIIQGFIGWFMLTIFSVSLISQLLN